MTKRIYAPSKIIPVRFHADELGIIDKNRKKATRSEYIRTKSTEKLST